MLLEKVSDADDALHLYDVFMDGANYLGNVSSFSNKKEADTKIDYATASLHTRTGPRSRKQAASKAQNSCEIFIFDKF